MNSSIIWVGAFSHRINFLKILNTFPFLCANKMWVTKAGINTIANRQDPDQTASRSSLIWGLHCLFRPFLLSTSVLNFGTYTVYAKACLKPPYFGPNLPLLPYFVYVRSEG